MPEALPSSAESSIIGLLTSTGNVFRDQCVTEQTGCAYQARFLQNLVSKYWSMKRPELPATTTGMAADEQLMQIQPNQQPCNTPFESATRAADSRIQGKKSDGLLLSVPLPTFSVQKDQELGSQPSWYSNLMESNNWEGLYTDTGSMVDDAMRASFWASSDLVS